MNAAMTDKPKIRLYVPAHYDVGHALVLHPGQSHYLAHVMRCHTGDTVAVFNGQDGEWIAEIAAIEKKSVTLRLKEPRLAQRNSPDLWLAFAPVKNRTEFIVEKAVELGVSCLLPVYTRHTVIRSINREKMEAYTIEAAEQCERHDVPPIEERRHLQELLELWPQDRGLLYGDESGGGEPLRDILPALPPGKYGVLVGPEGGFSREEHQLLASVPFVKAFSMGPRILRSDTAAIAAIACMQAWLGDWDARPAFAAQDSA